MRIPALLASVLLATTTLGVPMAHGDDRDDEARHERAGFRDARTRGWVTLAAMDIQASKTVDIDEGLGRFRRLRVQAIRGAAYVDFIEIRYANGEQQHVDVKRRIGRGEVGHRSQWVTSPRGDHGSRRAGSSLADPGDRRALISTPTTSAITSPSTTSCPEP